MSRFDMEPRELNLGPHACATGTVLTKPPPCPLAQVLCPLSERPSYQKYFEFCTCPPLEYLFIHSEMAWGGDPKSRQKIHFCSICALHT